MTIAELTKVRARGGSYYFEDSSGKMVAKECRECKEVVPLNGFHKDKRGLGGKVSKCIECCNRLGREYKRANPDKIREQRRKYYEENREVIRSKAKERWERNEEHYLEYYRNYYRKNRDEVLEHKRKWREDNREYQNRLVREWAKRNPDRIALRDQRRRAREASLPEDFTPEQMSSTLEFFDNGCALTGESENLDWDHVIPISLGVGGTTEANMIPLRSDLNKRKSNLNIFEWFERSKDALGLNQDKFDNLIKFIAEKNGMTPEEYRSFYYEQFNKNEGEN